MPNDRVSVLLLEDNPTDAELLLHSLERTGLRFEHRVASSRDDFLCEVEALTPDLVLADYSLPQFTAIDALKVLREMELRVPLIVITGDLGDEMAAECIKQGARDYLLKDRLGRLPQAVRQALDLSRLERDARDRQRQIRECERRFRTLADAIPQMVWTANAHGAREYCNARWYRYTGMAESADRDSKSWWAEFIHESDRADCLVRWRNSLSTGDIFEAECRVSSAADGTYRWFLCRATAECDEDRKPIRWFGTWTDIDEQKKNDEALSQKQKLDSIGILAAGIAHDFNNLLTGILGGASFAIESMPSDHPVRPMLDIVVTASQRASMFTQQLLAYAGKARISSEAVSLARLIPETCSLLSSSISRKIQITFEIETNLPAVKGDPGQMQQVVMNLVINGSEAIGDQPGLIVVRTNSLTIDAAGAEEWWPGEPSRKGVYVLLEVSDTGCGMDERTRAKIFDPFFTTKFTGRGLGLAAVAGIVRGARGAIKVVSAPGRGTTFRVVLPATRRAVAVPAVVPSRVLHGAVNIGILIVDDEEIVRNTLSAMVAKFGARPLLTEDGSSGVRLFASRRDDIALIVLDLNMPGQPIEETIEAFRRIRADVPILLATGYSSMEVDGYVRKYGRIRYLPKPFTLNSLREAIAEFLESGRVTAA